MLQVKAPRGTKDLLPKDTFKWQYVENIIHDLCKNFGFEEIRVPVFEHTELFERGVGDTTDVVQKEMYTFNDKGGRSITLRPEGTAGITRAYLENNLYADAQPTKLYYLFSCYRYEKPQAGRLREFHQFGVETFGSYSPVTDAETISLPITLLDKLGVKDVNLYINSVGCPKCREKYNIKLKEYFYQRIDDLCETCKTRLETNPMRIIDCKSTVCSKIALGAPKILYEQCEECSSHFNLTKKYLDSMGIKYEVDDTIVRGLDYYTTTVFEIKVNHSVICGGGRYNNLVEELGGNPSPGVGFGLGLERLMLILEEQKVSTDDNNHVKLYIASIGEEADLAAQKIVFDLRLKGIHAEKDHMGRSVKAQMKYADKIHAENVIVLGENEINLGTASLKNMATGEQKIISLTDLKDILFEEEIDKCKKD